MPPKINAAFVEKVLVRFIRDELGKCGCEKGILGLSGGLDSAVCAALAARALGPRNVLGLIMPYGKAFPRGRPRRRGTWPGASASAARRSTSPPRSTPTSPPIRRQTASGGGTRWPASACPSSTTIRPGEGGLRPGDEQQDRAPHRLRHDPRRHGLRRQPHGRPLQDPGPRARRAPARPGRDPRRRPRRPASGPARPTRARSASPTRSSTRSSTVSSKSGRAGKSSSKRGISRRPSTGSSA